ncbi:coiled-coil domain-containing protein 74B isoform X3 [Sorex araneus]|uniref:coiled-coil domain-containing protein 74B isoform X3 n=1 Tax=Sorex araneus TaxID=42254 RepID=UPI0024334053|nr:coiled-coil domain-containing protein 74B isoform X3 [Sorex araneus]
MSVTGVPGGSRTSNAPFLSSRSSARPRQRPPAVPMGVTGQHGWQPGTSGEAQKRVVDLEKSLQFLQQQHSETLIKLHEEIEHLKRENKDLHYKLIMNLKPSKKGSLSSSSIHSVKSFSNSTVSEKKRRPGEALAMPQPNRQDTVNAQGKARLQPSSTKKQDLKSDTCQKMDQEEESLIATLLHKLDKASGVQGQAKEEEAEALKPAATSGLGNPHKGKPPPPSLPTHMRKPTTLHQCEVVIRQLWNTNLLQAQELQHLKSLLEGNQKLKAASEEAGLSSPNLILSPSPMAERAILPALRQTLKSNFAERQKRLQVVQSRRLHRSVL